MDERGRKRTSKWDLIGGKRNLGNNGRENIRDGDYRGSSNEYESYSGRHSSGHAAEGNSKDYRSKYKPDVTERDGESGNRCSWRNNSFDRDSRGFSEAGTNWDEDGSRKDHTHSPKSSWQRSVRSRSRGKSRSRSRSRSPVSVYRHESGMDDRHRSRPEVPVQTCRDFTSGRCRRGSHCPFLHLSTQNNGRRYDYEQRVESYRGGKYSHYNASDGQYNDFTRDTSESKRDYDRNSRGMSSNHGAEREPRRIDIPCSFFAAGNCRHGKFCHFSHQIQALRSSGERARDGRWKKNQSPEKIGQVDSGTELSNTVDPRNTEKIGLVDRGAKFSATEYGKEGRWGTHRSPSGVSQIERDMPFSETHDPVVIAQGKESQNKDFSSSRWANNMEADYAEPGASTTIDKLAEANQQSQLKSHNHENINSTSELKGVVNWIGDKMSPEWNLKVAPARTFAKDEPAYAIQMSGSVSRNVPSQIESQGMHNFPYEMPNMVEKANSQQIFNPINVTSGAFSYDKNVGSHVSTNLNSGFSSGNSTKPSTQDVLAGVPGNLNAVGQGKYMCVPNFPGKEDAGVIRTSRSSTTNYDMHPVKPNSEDPRTSEATFGASPASALASQAHLTDLSASLAHLLGKGQELPQLYTAINPLNAVSSVDTSNRIVSQYSVESVQPYPPIGSKEPNQPVCDNISEIERAHHHPNPGLCRTSEYVKQETPSERNAGEAYKNGCMEKDLVNKPATESKPKTNPQTIPLESTKGKDKPAELREGSPLGNMEGAGKFDGGKKGKDAKTLRGFKHALVNFVKELLKPAWKDGQIDKEGYKTIVKKVVDKVTGTIQETNIPQTSEKVDHYLSASKPKLTKLVQAYVDRNSKKQV